MSIQELPLRICAAICLVASFLSSVAVVEAMKSGPERNVEAYKTGITNRLGAVGSFFRVRPDARPIHGTGKIVDGSSALPNHAQTDPVAGNANPFGPFGFLLGIPYPNSIGQSLPSDAAQKIDGGGTFVNHPMPQGIDALVTIGAASLFGFSAYLSLFHIPKKLKLRNEIDRRRDAYYGWRSWWRRVWWAVWCGSFAWLWSEHYHVLVSFIALLAIAAALEHIGELETAQDGIQKTIGEVENVLNRLGLDKWVEGLQGSYQRGVEVRGTVRYWDIQWCDWESSTSRFDTAALKERAKQLARRLPENRPKDVFKLLSAFPSFLAEAPAKGSIAAPKSVTSVYGFTPFLDYRGHADRCEIEKHDLFQLSSFLGAMSYVLLLIRYGEELITRGRKSKKLVPQPPEAWAQKVAEVAQLHGHSDRQLGIVHEPDWAYILSQEKKERRPQRDVGLSKQRRLTGFVAQLVVGALSDVPPKDFAIDLTAGDDRPFDIPGGGEGPREAPHQRETVIRSNIDIFDRYAAMSVPLQRHLCAYLLMLVRQSGVEDPKPICDSTALADNIAGRLLTLSSEIFTTQSLDFGGLPLDGTRIKTIIKDYFAEESKRASARSAMSVDALSAEDRLLARLL